MAAVPPPTTTLQSRLAGVSSVCFGSLAALWRYWRTSGTAVGSLESLGFWPVVGLLLLTRYVDVARYGGETLSGTPSTSSGLKRYALWLLVLSSAAWLAVLLTRQCC